MHTKKKGRRKEKNESFVRIFQRIFITLQPEKNKQQKMDDYHAENMKL